MGRALLGVLYDHDAHDLRQSVLAAVIRRSAIFGDAAAVQRVIVEALDAAPVESRYAALALFALVQGGLRPSKGPGSDLAPELFTLADALGVNLSHPTSPRVSAT